MDMGKEKKVPLVGQWINGVITAEKDGTPVPYMYLGQPTAAAMAKLSADYLTNVLGRKKIALFYDQTNSYTVSQVEAFKEYCAEKKINIVTEQTIIADTTDFKTHLTSIRNAGADAIYQLGYHTSNKIYVQTLDQLGMTDIVTMGDVNFAPPFLATLSDASVVKNLYFPLNVDLADTRLSTVAVVYMQTWNDVPSKEEINVKYYLSYDMIYMSAEAIRKVLNSGEKLTGENVNKALEQTTIDGLSGPLAFSSASHQVSGKQVSMFFYSINEKYKMEGAHALTL
jgi:ABC-type branched-subunit amino acid transport system substrate-binding protein